MNTHTDFLPYIYYYNTLIKLNIYMYANLSISIPITFRGYGYGYGYGQFDVRKYNNFFYSLAYMKNNS